MTDDVLEVHLIADSTGETAARIARAAIAQFPTTDFTLVRHRRSNTKDSLRKALQTVRDRGGKPTAVLFTLVNDALADSVKKACAEMGVPCADLMTDAIRALRRISGTEPDQVPLRPVGVEVDYFTRIEAIDFAVRNDDGAAPSALREGDICLIGPSRSGKTPLSIFLGYMGYKVVNVPLIPGITPPPELFTVDPWRIVGLTMDAEKLQHIRSERVRGQGFAGMKDGYVNVAAIYDELDEVNEVQRRLGCPVLNTTDMALEESAARIIDIVKARAQRLGGTLRRPANTTSEL